MQKITHHLVDDMTGEPADETVEFALDGVGYEIDLTEARATALRNALSDFVEAARRAPRGNVTKLRRPRGTGSATPDRAQTKAMREWARQRGYPVKDRGRIPAEVVEAYHGRGVA